MIRHINTATAVAIVTTIAIVSSTFDAAAADLPGTVTVPTVQPEPVLAAQGSTAAWVDRWTGFYVGAHLGGVTTQDLSDGGMVWTGGAQAGFLQQFGAFVLGSELAVVLHDELAYELTPGAGLQQDWSVNLTGHAGLALGDTLLYGLAGAALTELQPTGATTSGAGSQIGFIWGAGIEQSIGGGWSLRAEYQQTSFFDVESSVSGNGREDDLTAHAVTLGVNFRF